MAALTANPQPTTKYQPTARLILANLKLLELRHKLKRKRRQLPVLPKAFKRGVAL